MNYKLKSKVHMGISYSNILVIVCIKLLKMSTIILIIGLLSYKLTNQLCVGGMYHNIIKTSIITAIVIIPAK